MTSRCQVSFYAQQVSALPSVTFIPSPPLSYHFYFFNTDLLRVRLCENLAHRFSFRDFLFRFDHQPQTEKNLEGTLEKNMAYRILTSETTKITEACLKLNSFLKL